MDKLALCSKVQLEFKSFKKNLASFRNRYLANRTKKETDDKSEQLAFFWSLLETCLGYGQMWRCPSLAYRTGGAAFLVCYGILLFTIGNSSLFLEVALGQMTRKTNVEIFHNFPIASGIAMSSMIYVMLFVTIYTQITAYAIYYLYLTFDSPLRWTKCPINNTICKNMTPSFFLWQEVNAYPDFTKKMGTFNTHLVLSSLITWIVIYLCLISERGLLKKFKWFFMPFPPILMTWLIYESLQKTGANEGIQHLFIPSSVMDFMKLEVWALALEQTLYSLGTGMLYPIHLAKQARPKQLTYIDCYLITIVIYFTSIFWSIVVFTNIGIITHKMKVKFGSIRFFEPSLIFTIYPHAINYLPGPTFLSILFFLIVINAGISSNTYILNSVVESHKKIFPQSKLNLVLFTLLLAVGCFILGIPLIAQNGYVFFESFDRLGGVQSLVIIGSFEILVISYCYGVKRFCNDIKMSIGYSPNCYYIFFWYVNGFLIFGIGVGSFFRSTSYDLMLFAWDYTLLIAIICPILYRFFLQLVISLLRRMSFSKIFRPNIELVPVTNKTE